MNLDANLTLNIKINSRHIKNLNIKAKIVKPLKENVENIFATFGLTRYIESTNHERKELIHLTLSRLKTFAFQNP